MVKNVVRMSFHSARAQWSTICYAACTQLLRLKAPGQKKKSARYQSLCVRRRPSAGVIRVLCLVQYRVGLPRLFSPFIRAARRNVSGIRLRPLCVPLLTHFRLSR